MIVDQLKYLHEIKQAIQRAINHKGVAFDAGGAFMDYADEIMKIGTTPKPGITGSDTVDVWCFAPRFNTYVESERLKRILNPTFAPAESVTISYRT